jgi:asparagine synthase (glutamine-hydrolysing)
LQPGEILEARLDGERVLSKARRYHQWVIGPGSDITLAEAVERADELVMAAVKNQLESDVALGSLLSGGIDSSLVSTAAQTALGRGLRTFNVKFPEKCYDETWAAVLVANHIGSEHQTLLMDLNRGTWENITNLLRYAGQPFADTSLFAANDNRSPLSLNVT